MATNNPKSSTAYDEAVHLAEEALEELQAGNIDEARFVLDEARRPRQPRTR